MTGPAAADFIDIHSHILFGLDDGPATLEESCATLALARDAGTSDIVATPHANAQFAFLPDLIEQRVAELRTHVSGIRIHRGCDFHLQLDNIQDAIANPGKYTINGHRYLLVEFPQATILRGSDDILRCLLDAGMTPIVTHPERNLYLQRNPDVLARWVDEGCYVQVTAGACTGLFGARVKGSVHDLMKRGLVHFVASDAHDASSRTPDLRDAHRMLLEEWDVDRVRALFVNHPAAVLAGDDLDTGKATSESSA